MQFYRQIYDNDVEIASKLSSIYRSMKILYSKSIMESIFNEVISIGDALFQNINQTKNNEIINDNFNRESTESISFKYCKEKNAIKKIPHLPMNVKKNNEKNKSISPGYNTLNIIKPSDGTDSVNETANKILIILSNDENKEKEDEEKVVDKVDKNKIQEVEKNENLYIIPLKNNKKAADNADEINAPKSTFKIANSMNHKRYELSNIKKDNKNINLPNENIKEGENPNFDFFVKKTLEYLLKHDFQIVFPENHLTLVVDISFLSGSQNKNMLCVNLFITMEALNAFGIKFSVWMFADRNLCFCIKKPTDVFDNARKTIIREVYFLKRVNSESFPISALYTINRNNYDDESNMLIMFSTFVSAQILTPHMNWEEIASSCSVNKNLIGFIEPCQHTDPDIIKRRNEVLKETNFSTFVEFNPNIYESIGNLLLKIFHLTFSKGFYQKHNVLQPEIINLPQTIKYSNNTNDFNDDIYICKKVFTQLKSEYSFTENTELKVTQLNGEFEDIDTSNMIFGDSNYSSCFLYPNKPTRFELKPKGNIIDANGLVKMHITNGTNVNIFQSKTGEKVRDYIVDIIIDCSIIIKQYSLNHCFLSIVSILSSLKDLEKT